MALIQLSDYMVVSVFFSSLNGLPGTFTIHKKKGFPGNELPILHGNLTGTLRDFHGNFTGHW